MNPNPIGPKDYQPITESEWMEALLSPCCSKELAEKVKTNAKFECTGKKEFRRVEALPQEKQIQAITEICRKEIRAEPATPKLQIQC